MVHTDNLIPCEIYNIGISLLGIHQNHFVLVAEHTLQLVYIQQFDAYELHQLACAVAVNLPFIADCRAHPTRLQQPLQPICTRNRVWVWKIMRLDIHMLFVNRPKQLFKFRHNLSPVTVLVLNTYILP